MPRFLIAALQPSPQFSQLKADGEVRWAVLNVATMLKRYAGLQDRLATAMQQGRPMGELLELIETEVDAVEQADKAASAAQAKK